MRIKGLFGVMILLFLSSSFHAQIEDPVHWKFSVEAGKEKNEAFVVASCDIEDTWHVYALKVSADPNAVGPMPTVLKVNATSDYKLKGAVTEGKYITHYDPNFEMDLNYFERTASFKQKIEILTDKPFKVSGVLEYMACNEVKCIFPDPEKFSINYSPNAEATADVAPGAADAQNNSKILSPVKWNVHSVKVNDNEYDIIFTAVAEKGWHVYSQHLESSEGPVASSFSFQTGSDFEKVGETTEGAPIKIYDPNFRMNVAFFESGAEFKQRIKVLGKADAIACGVDFMCCNDETCLPPVKKSFSVDLKTGVGTPVEESNNATPTPPSSTKFLYSLPGVDVEHPLTTECKVTNAAPVSGSSLWEIFILGFLGGLIALLTPCVFPMIPLTVSFFTKSAGQSKKKGIINASIYGFFIFGIYLLLSLPFHIFDQIDENILNNISTNVPLNISFFVIFIIFAISFFGYFEITLPSSFANKMDNASNVGGLVGSFFMALTLAIVSFSCTGPILGSLLAGSLAKDGGAFQLTVGMGGFGLALGIPFAIFAMFPGMLKSLPKSGGWLNSVKVVLGFVEVALAFKFLSQADLVDHWGFLKYELFLAVWVLAAFLTALYLFGFIRFPHDSPLKKRKPLRMGLAVAFFAFGLYLVSGFRYDERFNTYHSLSLLSGLAPPVGYSWAYPKECPHNLDCEHDYALAVERAKREGKPIFIDFTGYACVNCRKMEENVWVEPEVLRHLQENFIVVSLYVDDRKELPAELKESFTSAITNKTKEIETYGDRWAAFQIETFKSNAQPLYCILSPDEKLLNKPVGFTPDKEEYVQWMECGLSAFKSEEAITSNQQ